MATELTTGTPLADALNNAIQEKIVEVGWAGNTTEAAPMAEYLVLMLANGKTQDEVAAEISGDLLSLGPDDPTALHFAQWLFEQQNALVPQYSSAPEPAPDEQGAMDTAQDNSMGDFNMDVTTDGSGNELNAPTGPKAMRNGSGNGMRGGREKRIMGQINRAMDRTHDPNAALHRVRGQSGNERIARGPPTGPRMGVGRQPRTTNTRVASIAQGLANMGGPAGPGGMGPMNPMNGMNGMGGFGQPDIMAIMEQQRHMLQQMQMMMQQSGVAPNGHGPHGHGRGHGRPLYERTSRPNFRGRGGGFQAGSHQHSQGSDAGQGDPAQQGQQAGEDADMMQPKREPQNPEETVCKFNLRCSNRDCKFAHQSPAAPPNIPIDVKDVCSFGAACKNRKCVGRHPSPAIKAAHQSEMDCKFFPNCTNPHCPFKHPSMPPCRNGGECKVPGCKFTHVKTPCKFHPCTNRFCPFTHEEGQRGTFQDKVWVAGEEGEPRHVSERKFVDENAPEDVILPGSEDQQADANMPEVVKGFSIQLESKEGNHEGLKFLIMYSTSQRSLARNTRRCVSSKWAQPATLSSSRLASTCAFGSAVTTSKRHNVASSALAATGKTRSFMTSVTPPTAELPKDIAIIGGGLTGLATAYFARLHNHHASITVYEASDRLGGWIDTEEVQVTTPSGEKGKVIFQRGGRMLKTMNNKARYDDMAFWKLVSELAVENELQVTSEDEPLCNYIYYPDHLVAMPQPILDKKRPLDSAVSICSAIQTIFKEPIFNGAPSAAMKYFFGGGRKLTLKDGEDLSVGKFFGRATGNPELIDNTLGALMHGVWGGDIRNLSMQSGLFSTTTLPSPEKGKIWYPKEDVEFIQRILNEYPFTKRMLSIFTAMGESSEYIWFKNGFSTMTDALIRDLKELHVTFKLNTPVQSISLHPSERIAIKSSKSVQAALYDKVVSTIYAKTLAGLTVNKLPSLARSTAVTIRVVNIWYPTPNLNAPFNGIGYLIPSTTPHNPEGVLGVLFDSDREHRGRNYGGDTVPGTKFTVMMGGHYWGTEPSYMYDENKCIDMAKAAVERHLQISEEDAVGAVATTKLCHNCIPQHTVGHRERMANAHHELLKAFKGNLSVVGGSYQTPGINSSLRGAADIAYELANKMVPHPVGKTGLQRFTRPMSESWGQLEKKGFSLRFGNALRVI
ncbi:hypothetical protein QBC32DRAFT_210870 [Pseudoneurospora amorphoporcata]|uniref:protoporphyrinogen oxidase n=1 Tax=Pseudoneurospora amorphoporcata TaxID=241081 RepID=A0AAN6SG77_9PEZI|nr:hypothetical protein QBC32DRAFT_210870 [Pseudoneurospora amorphoporcata]